MSVRAAPSLVRSEEELVGLAFALGRGPARDWSKAERELARRAPRPTADAVAGARRRIVAGEDPLGEALCALRSPKVRRASGAVYTPPDIVRVLVGSFDDVPIARIVDPGAGSGRLLRAAARRHPDARLVAVERDPLASLVLRGTLHAEGLTPRLTVHATDYLRAGLGRARGRTLYVANPPYVRHHGIDAASKRWLERQARELGLRASLLSGLHVYFWVATLLGARAGDVGCFVTSSEWLDVNYGALVRTLLVGPLGGLGIDLLAPSVAAFADAQTTASIVRFEVGAAPATLSFRELREVGEPPRRARVRIVHRETLSRAARWTPLFRATPRRRGAYVELGELCRVHRGQVTGANRIWIAGLHSDELPESLSFPAITRARELFASGAVLDDLGELRRVIDLPEDLGELTPTERRLVERFLRRARAMGAASGYVASHRRAWWSVGLHAPAPILATYMARRPPAFVVNRAGARHINVAHGLYPRVPLGERALAALAAHLGSSTVVADGRTYAGGLTKFEPREMERLLVPCDAELERSLAGTGERGGRAAE